MTTLCIGGHYHGRSVSKADPYFVGMSECGELRPVQGAGRIVPGKTINRDRYERRTIPIAEGQIVEVYVWEELSKAETESALAALIRDVSALIATKVELPGERP